MGNNWENYRLGNGTYVDNGYDGIQPTVDLLSSLEISQSYSNLQLIWEYANWVLQKDPEMGIKVKIRKKWENNKNFFFFRFLLRKHVP